ncbi:MAG: MBL fold metallo-hydrolase [Bacteroidia bacterium]|nr:MBL fold metallo-hydrolase [Bacteroidia bacterium]
MQITFLGTGTSQGVPMIACDCEVCTSGDIRDKRLRTSVMIRQNSFCLVVDSGPDFRQQMLRENVKTLDAIVFTHEHKDHIAGLDDVRAFNYLTGRPMNVYASERVTEALKREFFYVFSGDTYPGIPKLQLHTIHGIPFDVGPLRMIPIEVLHLNLPVFGFRTDDFSYITDANFISPAEMDKIRGSKVLVLNALRKEKHVSHFTLSEAIKIAREIKAGTTYLTHISHQMGLHEALEKELPPGIHLAYDGLKLEI